MPMEKPQGSKRRPHRTEPSVNPLRPQFLIRSPDPAALRSEMDWEMATGVDHNSRVLARMSFVFVSAAFCVADFEAQPTSWDHRQVSQQSNARRTGPANSHSCRNAAFPGRLVTSCHSAPFVDYVLMQITTAAHTTAHTTANPVAASSHHNIWKDLPGAAEDYSHFEWFSSVVAGHSDDTAPTGRDRSRFRLLVCVWQRSASYQHSER